MTNTDEARRAVQETIEQLGGIDIVLANAVSYGFFTHWQGRMLIRDRAGRSSATGRITRG